MSHSLYVATHRGGLCNNLKCVLNALRMAQRDNVEFATSCAEMPSLFPDIPYIAEKDIPADALRVRDWRLPVFADDPLPTGFAQSPVTLGFADRAADGRNIDQEYARIPVALQQTYLALLDELNIAEQLQNTVEEFAAKHSFADALSLHMRTWMTDHWDKAPKRHAHYFKLENFINIVTEHPANTVFLSTDNASYGAALMAHFPERMIHLAEDPAFTPTQHAFMNILLLAKSPQLIGVKLSTFTEMAWWYSRCQSQVELI